MVVVVVVTLTCIIKSVITGQSPVTLELKNRLPQGQKKKVVPGYRSSGCTFVLVGCRLELFK